MHVSEYKKAFNASCVSRSTVAQEHDPFEQTGSRSAYGRAADSPFYFPVYGLYDKQFRGWVRHYAGGCLLNATLFRPRTERTGEKFGGFTDFRYF